MKHLIAGYIVVAAALSVFNGCSRAPEISFNEQVRPILNERCVNCHGGIRRQGDLSLLFRHEALATAESGERAIVPLKPNESEMLRRVSHADPKHRMPQDDDALTPSKLKFCARGLKKGHNGRITGLTSPPSGPHYRTYLIPRGRVNRWITLYFHGWTKKSCHLLPKRNAPCSSGESHWT